MGILTTQYSLENSYHSKQNSAYNWNKIWEVKTLSETDLYEKEYASKMDLSHVEQLATRLLEVEKVIKDYETKVSEFEKTIAEYKQKSDVERHFHELAGLPYEDKTPRLEEELKNSKSERDNAFSEKEKLRGEILTGLSSVSIPLDKMKPLNQSEDEVVFPFRDGKQYPAIISFIRHELKFGCAPVYISFSPEGLRVFGLSDELSAMKELVTSIENLKTKAKEKVGQAKKIWVTVEDPEPEAEEKPGEFWKIDFPPEDPSKEKTFKGKFLGKR